MGRIGDPYQGFHSPVQVAVHHVGAPQPYLVAGVRVLARLRARVRLTRAEGVDPRVLEEPAKDAADPDAVGQAGHARLQRAHAAHPDLDGHPGLPGPVERVDHYLVDERVALEGDLRRLARPGPRGLAADAAHDARAQRLRGDEQAAVAALPAVPGEVVEQVGDGLADQVVRREKPEVLVQARCRRMVVAGADVAVAPQGAVTFL